MYVYVWRYAVRPGSEAAFEAAYGPDGEWVRLFRDGDGYLDTLLMRDLEVPGAYLTVDRWASRADFDGFRSAQHDAWEALDARCALLTDREDEIGHYEVIQAG